MKWSAKLKRLRCTVDDQLAIIARTDALGVLGFDEAIERANAYKEAGAHAIFVEAPTTYEQLARITREVPGIPHIINLVEGGKTPLVSRQEASDLGFQIMLVRTLLYVVRLKVLHKHCKF